MALAMTSRSTLSKRLTSGTSMISTYRISMKSMRKSLPILLTCRNTEQASKLSSTHDEKYCSRREKHSDINLLLSLQLIPSMIDQKTSISEQCLELDPWKINAKTYHCRKIQMKDVQLVFLEHGTVAGFKQLIATVTKLDWSENSATPLGNCRWVTSCCRGCPETRENSWRKSCGHGKRSHLWGWC